MVMFRQVNNCASSFVEVFDGPTRRDKKVGDFCGLEEMSRPKVVLSTGSQLLLSVSLGQEESVGLRWSSETGE